MLVPQWSLLAASLLFAQAPPTAVQSVDTAVLVEIKALRRSVEQLTEVVKLFAQQAAERDSAMLLSQIIDMDERRLTQMQGQLDALRSSRAALVTEIAQMRGSADTYSKMAAGDPTGRAQAMMEEEKMRTSEQVEQKTYAMNLLDGQIAQLEGEIIERKQRALEMRQRLDQKVRLRP